MSGAQTQPVSSSSSKQEVARRFQYPTSREIVCRVMEACGYGASNWPESHGNSLARSTIKRAAKNQPLSPESQRQLLADAIEVLIAPFFGLFGGRVSSQLMDDLMTLAKRWDRLVAQLSTREEYALARPWGAFPVLRLLALRCGAMLGALSVVDDRDIADPFDGLAFCRFFRKTLETVWPDETATSWCRRLDGVLSKDTVRVWLKDNPGMLASVEGLARRLAENSESLDAVHLEWQFRVCCGLGNITGMLAAYLGSDDAGLNRRYAAFWTCSMSDRNKSSDF